MCICFRCIVMVGLPYPNIRSPELKEKMDYLNANMVNGTTISASLIIIIIIRQLLCPTVGRVWSMPASLPLLFIVSLCPASLISRFILLFVVVFKNAIISRSAK